MKRLTILILCFSMVLGVAFCLASCSKDTKEPSYVEIKVENYGTIIVKLNPTYAPKTVKNFLSLVDDGFYDGLTFHRIIPDFMVQGGDPKGDGTGGSGKNIKGEFSANGVTNPTSHKRGVISMARGNDNDSASSQFFICHADSPHLDGKYAAFGRVVKGIEVVDALAAYVEDNAQVLKDTNGGVYKNHQPKIESIRRIDYTEGE